MSATPLRMPAPEENVMVPMPSVLAVAYLAFVKAGRPGSFTINFDGEGFPAGWDERRTGRVVRAERRQGERRSDG